MRRGLIRALRIGIVVLAVAVAATAGIALAQTDPPPGDTATVAEHDGNGEEAARRHRHHRHPRLRGLIACTDVPGQAIREGIRAGKTFAEIVADHGGSTAAVSECALGKLSEALEAAVASGRITPAQQEAILSRTTERLEELLNTVHPLRTAVEQHREKLQQRRQRRHDHLAEVLGEPFAEIQAKLREGATLAELGAAKGLSVEELVAQLLAPYVAEVRERAEAGTITPEQARRLIEHATDRVTRAVTTAPDEQGPRPRARQRLREHLESGNG